jgi:hypothetical protein
VNADDYRLPRSRLRPPLHIQRPPDKIAVWKHRRTPDEWEVAVSGVGYLRYHTFEDAWRAVDDILSGFYIPQRYMFGAVGGEIRREIRP